MLGQWQRVVFQSLLLLLPLGIPSERTTTLLDYHALSVALKRHIVHTHAGVDKWWDAIQLGIMRSLATLIEDFYGRLPFVWMMIWRVPTDRDVIGWTLEEYRILGCGLKGQGWELEAI